MIKELFVEMMEYIKANKNKTLGAFLGFLIGILILTIGFFKTIFIVLCTWLGFFIGSKSYSWEDIKGFLIRLFTPTKRM
ncbi:conserved hypothetical protein [[Clostridium] ultunense Esp]|uniref:Small integral membrane protein n=1 Tax=[Clostridium] ultunense Esp TaxID=1288971 RepID=M1ZKT3_9FIRM|nr:DUF2273 domain-containing protein [Schnuerera ultunensis]CCQ96002.1 conserved hypothetical protein [[Clostridium] ultunense Esp]SHD77160.1 conserved protein of unknown function [[Clostridium] ultunense Esp]